MVVKYQLQLLFIFFLSGYSALLFSQDMPTLAKAYSLKTNELIYTEHFSLDEGLVVSRYIDSKGEEFAVKKVDTSNSLLAPNFELMDFRSETTMGVKTEVGQPVMYTHNIKKDKLKQKILKPKQTLVVDLGFNFWLQENLPNLINSTKPLLFDFPFLNKMIMVRMRVLKAECTLTNEDHICLKMAPDNIILRRLAGSTDLVLSREHQRLLQFSGTGNMVDAEGKPFKANIYYEYGLAEQ